jgi:hypothetical protein
MQLPVYNYNYLSYLFGFYFAIYYKKINIIILINDNRQNSGVFAREERVPGLAPSRKKEGS